MLRLGWNLANKNMEFEVNKNANLKPEHDLRNLNMIFLSGSVGVGKSVFARGFLRGYTKNANLIVPSPTFLLSLSYKNPLTQTANNQAATHCDFYRLNHPSLDEIHSIGFLDSLKAGPVLVEWPERLLEVNEIVHLLPRYWLRVDISIPNHYKNQRKVCMFAEKNNLLL